MAAQQLPLDVLPRPAQQLDADVCQPDVPAQHLLLPAPHQHAVALVAEARVQLGPQDLLVLVQRLVEGRQRLLRRRSDHPQHLPLVPHADRLDVVQLEAVLRLSSHDDQLAVHCDDEAQVAEHLPALLLPVRGLAVGGRHLELPVEREGVRWLQHAQLGGVGRVEVRPRAEAQHGLVVVLVIVQREAVVDEEARVALAPVRVEHLLPSLDGLQADDREAVQRVVERPLGVRVGYVPRLLVVEHVRVWHQPVRLHAVQHQAEDAGDDHQARPHELVVAEASELRHRSLDILVPDAGTPADTGRGEQQVRGLRLEERQRQAVRSEAALTLS